MLANFISGRAGQITMRDSLINKLSVVFILLIFFTPHIFLSDTALRRKLPLFKSGKFLPSALGLVIVSVACIILSSVVGSYYSDEYKADMENHAYVVSSVEEATCTADGISYLTCEYCAQKTEEIIPASGHAPAEKARAEATCTEDGKITYQCELCGEITSETIDKSGHRFEEILHKDATCTAEGETVSECALCGESHTDMIPMLSHDMAEASRTEATCTKDGAVVSACSMCGYESAENLPAGHKITTVSHRAASDYEDGETVTKCDVCSEVFVEVLPCRYPLGCKENPYDFELSELVSKLTGKSFLQEYEGKYVRITGTMLHMNGSESYFVSEDGKGIFCLLDNFYIIDYGKEADIVGKVTASEDHGAILEDCSMEHISYPDSDPLSPFTITSWTSSMDYVGGVEWKFTFRNNSAKTIKYIDLEWVCFNAVEDPVANEINGSITHSIRFTGPLDPGETSAKLRNGTKFYNHSYDHAWLSSAKVEFMDGEVIYVTNYPYFRDIVA